MPACYNKRMNCVLILLQTGFMAFYMVVAGSAHAEEKKATYTFEVAGVEEALADNVRVFLNNMTADCDTSASMRRSLQEKIPQQVQLALQPYGYYQAQVSDIDMQADNGCWHISININPGQPVTIRHVDVQLLGPGRSHETLKAIDVSDYLTVGEVFVDQEYQRLKQALRQWANQYGFLDADFTARTVDVFTRQRAADITLSFATGPRYRLNEVRVEQKPEFMRPRFLRGLIGLEPDQYLNNQTLIDVRKRLVASRYFDHISVTYGDKNQQQATVPVLVSVTPGYRIDYSVGLGYTTDTGARSTFEYQHHRLNDRGFQLSAKLQLAQVNNEFSASMKFPSLSNPDEKWYNLDIGHRQERNDVYDADTTKIGVSQTRLQTDRWQNINFIDVLQEDYQIGDQQNSSQLLVPGTGWTFQQVDDPLNPRFGFKAQMDFKLATEQVFSDMSMVQISGRVKSILPVADRDRIIMRAEIGTTATSDFNQLPASYRYYAGGDQSVRGFDYKSLSPVNASGEAVGGKHLAVASVEYEYRLNDSYALAVFADGGNAFTDEFELAGAVGVGFRWFSPIGPLRVDVGVPVTDADHDFRIHLSLGPDL